MLPLACADFTFPLLTHEQALELISMLGFEGVDIGLFEGRSHLLPSKEFADPTAAGLLARKVTDRGLKVADVFLQTDPDFTVYAINHPDANNRNKARDWFSRTLEYAATCGSSHVTVLPGVEFDDVFKSDSLKRCHEELAWRVEQARICKIEFAVEAHIGSIVKSPQEALSLVHAVPGLTLTLDYTHFTRDGLPDSDVEPLVAHASHFHARGAREGRLQCSFKENVIDYDRILKAMQKSGYSGFIGIEYVWVDWQHCNEVDNLSETILFREFFRSKLYDL